MPTESFDIGIASQQHSEIKLRRIDFCWRCYVKAITANNKVMPGMNVLRYSSHLAMRGIEKLSYVLRKDVTNSKARFKTSIDIVEYNR